MAEYTRKPNPFLMRGINISQPADRIGPQYAQVIQNMRCLRIGEWRQRPGLSRLQDSANANGVDGIVRSVMALNNEANNTYRRIVGTSTGKLYIDNTGHNSFGSPIATGFSGDPLTYVAARPERSPYPYAILADRTKIGKLSATGAFSEWGLAAPKLPVSAQLAQIAYKTIETCNATTGFTAAYGSISAPSRVNTTVNKILYDVQPSQPGETPFGWASIAPVELNENIQPGMQISVSGVETVVDSVFQPITSTTIASISYDSIGSVGNCTIQLATPSAGLKRDSLIQLTHEATVELVRVLSVTTGPSGLPSIRAVTNSSFVTGDTVSGFPSFRAYLPNTASVGQAITSNYIELSVNAEAGLASVTRNWAAPDTKDLTTISLGGTSRPISGDDYIHLSLRVEDFSIVQELQIQFDFDSEDANRFTQNYFFKSIRQPDFIGAVDQTSPALTAQQIGIQRQQLDAYTRQSLEDERARLYQEISYGGSTYGGGLYGSDERQSRINEIDSLLNGGGYDIDSGNGPISVSATTGANQWTELKIPLNAFQRVGSDSSRGWRNIRAMRITAQRSTDTATKIGIDAVWIGGSYGLSTQDNEDVNGGSQLVGVNYVYRARNTVTGSRSNPSPPMRAVLYPKRQGVYVTIPAGYGDPQADVFDLFRIGGTLSTYHLVASVAIVPNSGITYQDIIPDDVAITYPMIETDRFKPWIRPDIPATGTCRVVGTTIERLSGAYFNLNWVRGNQIIIDGKVFSLYAPPSSTTRLELNESAGDISIATFYLPEPMMDGQPLPVVFGPYGTGVSGEFFFGLGDPVNPGYLYWTNGNDPESCGDVNILEVSGPSEPLLGGTILDGTIFVWSDRRSWRIFPSFSGGGTGGGSQFYAQETAMGKGLASRWSLTVGDQIYFVSWDGIYATRGDAVTSLTDDTLAPLFRRDGASFKPPAAVAGKLPPLGTLGPISFEAADLPALRLTYSKDGLYFHFMAIGVGYKTLYYSFLTQGWMEDTLAGDALTVTSRQYGGGRDQVLHGSSLGKLYSYSQLNLDEGTGVPVRLVTAEESWDDTRTLKALGDFMLDADPGASAISISQRLWYNNGTSYFDTGQPVTGTIGRQKFIRMLVDNTSEADLMRRSVALELNWTTHPAGQTVLYEWQPAAIVKTEAITPIRPTDWERPAGGKNVWLQGMVLTANTFGQTGNVTIVTDNDSRTVEINHDGEQTKSYIWEPLITHQVRIYCDVPWQLLQLQFVFKMEPEKVTRWHTQNSSLGMVGYAHIREMLIAHESTSDITLNIIIDGVEGPVYTIPASGGLRTKTYFPVRALKGKLFQFILTSAEGFRLYLGDCEVKIKPWGMPQSTYLTSKPFGDGSFDDGDGARI